MERTRRLLLLETGVEKEQLFISIGCSNRLSNALQLMSNKLRERHVWFDNLQQVRDSVISLWTREHDLRTVQKMAGHRYVGSTERYERARLTRLQDALEACHPLR